MGNKRILSAVIVLLLASICFSGEVKTQIQSWALGTITLNGVSTQVLTIRSRENQDYHLALGSKLAEYTMAKVLNLTNTWPCQGGQWGNVVHYIKYSIEDGKNILNTIGFVFDFYHDNAFPFPFKIPNATSGTEIKSNVGGFLMGKDPDDNTILRCSILLYDWGVPSPPENPAPYIKIDFTTSLYSVEDVQADYWMAKIVKMGIQAGATCPDAISVLYTGTGTSTQIKKITFLQN
jgi:hypothetical protein